VSDKSFTSHDIPQLSFDALVECWSAARSRAFLARHQGREPEPRDLFAELAYGVRIAEEATAGRWCVIADLLRSGMVDSWYRAADGMGITETEARDGFHTWIASQVDLRHRTGSIGHADDEGSDTSGPPRCIESRGGAGWACQSRRSRRPERFPFAGEAGSVHAAVRAIGPLCLASTGRTGPDSVLRPGDRGGVREACRSASQRLQPRCPSRGQRGCRGAEPATHRAARGADTADARGEQRHDEGQSSPPNRP
jgi:hypothetical protein